MGLLTEEIVNKLKPKIIKLIDEVENYTVNNFRNVREKRELTYSFIEETLSRMATAAMYAEELERWAIYEETNENFITYNEETPQLPALEYLIEKGEFLKAKVKFDV